MSGSTVVLAVLLGLGAGVLAGLFGVGGGILFVPTLLLLGLGQVEAGATSLLAIVPTAAVAAFRQRGRGTMDVRAALAVGISSIVGVEAGVRIATWLDPDHLRTIFGLLLAGVAVQLVVTGVRDGRGYAEEP